MLKWQKSLVMVKIDQFYELALITLDYMKLE